MKIKESYHTYAIITILFWSLSYVLTRLASHYFSAFSLGFLRYAFASAALIIIALAARLKLPEKKDLGWFLLTGFVGFFLYIIVFNLGCKEVSSGTSSVIIATVPMITALLARVVYKEKLSIIKWAASAIEFSGVIVLTLLNSTFSFNKGLAWLIVASLLLSVYNLLQRRLTKKYSGLQTSTYGIFFGTVMLAIFMPNAIVQIKTAPPVVFIYLAILGVLSSALAYASWAQAFKKADNASSVSNYMFVTPFLASLMGYILAGEGLDKPTLVGGGIILLGLLLFNFGERLLAKKHGERLLAKKHKEAVGE